MVTAFAQAGLNDYEVKDGGILIPKTSRSEYVRAIADSRAMPGEIYLPRVEAIEKSSPFESSSQRAERLKLALERELANSIQRMPGVESAFVHIDEALAGKGLQRRRTASAVVTVQPTTPHGLRLERIESIRRLVSAAKVELNPANVSVTDLASGTTHGGEQYSTPQAEYTAHKIRFERLWNDKIRSLIKIGGAEVSSNVDLEYQTAEGTSVPTWFPVRVAVSVGIPDTFYDSVLSEIESTDSRRKVSLAEIETTTHERVRKTISRLLPGTDEDAAACITIVTFPSVRVPTSADSPLANPVIIPKTWMPAVMLTALLIGLFAFFSLRSKEAGSGDEEVDTLRYMSGDAFETAYSDREIEEKFGDAAATAVTATSVDSVPGEAAESYKDELNRLVRENPAAAAESLKQWINKAG